MNAVTFGQSAFIFFREGAEALLIIAALVAYLTRIGAPERARTLYVGMALAVVASIAFAWVLWAYFGGGHNDLVEGITMLVAAGLLVYVSGWLFARRDIARWQGYLRDRVDQALDRAGGMISLSLVAFLAVFREGAETALFLHTLAMNGGGWGVSVISGIAVGVAGLTVLFFLVKAFAIRLPLKPFFAVTAGLLYTMAILFVGPGLMELQELNWLPFTDAGVAEWLVELGINPSWEGLAIQALMVAIVPVALKLPALNAPKTATEGAKS